MKLPWESVITVGAELIDSLFTSDEEKAEAKLKLATLQQQGKLKEMQTAMSAIISESQSQDKWTSRARPSFMYVIYILVLSAIPMGVLTALSPEVASNITLGFNDWLAAIPESMWALFGTGYLGYSASRTYDKHSRNKHQ